MLYPARRRRSSLLPVLNRLASLGLSINSTTDLTKATFEPPTPHDSDDDLDSTYMPAISRMSSVSLDDFNLGRTVSNSTTSTFPALTPKQSTNSYTSYTGEDNPVFDEPHGAHPNGGIEVSAARNKYVQFVPMRALCWEWIFRMILF